MAIVKKMGGYYALRQKHQKSRLGVIKKIYQLISRGFQHETNSYLPFNNEMKGPPNFLHGTYGIFISGGASIGKNCTIYHQVTIGSNMLVDSKGFGSPSIGDNCLIGAGAKIVGNIKVGNNCRIGANAVVTFDIPDNSIVVMGSAKVIPKEGIVNRIYQRTPKGWGYLKDGKIVLETEESVLARLGQYHG